MSSSHQEFKKTEQVVGRAETTSHNIMDDYVNDPPNNLGTSSLSNAQDAIRRAQAEEDALNDEKHARQYRAETKKHTGGRFGALEDAEEGGVPAPGAGDVDRAGVMVGEGEGKPVRHDVETSLLK